MRELADEYIEWPSKYKELCKEGTKWMRAAAERGYSLAQVDIAYYYKTGLCFPKD